MHSLFYCHLCLWKEVLQTSDGHSMPLSTTYAPPSVTFFIFSVHIMGASSIMGAINVVVTIMNMRALELGLMKMPFLYGLGS